MASNRWESWVEKAIQDARDRGLFDNLEGEGRPINWDDDSLVDEDWAMAFRLMREHGFAPDWIELQKEIRTEVERARSAVLNVWLWRRQRLAGAREAQRTTIDSEWRRARAEFTSTIAELNVRIADFNLIVPFAQLQKFRIDAEQELIALGIED
jgi:DnaJ family protein C protein 28